MHRHASTRPTASQPCTLAAEERSLRRRLLYRMLKGYDFDAPVMRYEAITDAACTL